MKHESFDSLLENLPPLDVIMVWHAYLLNPGYDHYNHNDAHCTHSFLPLDGTLKILTGCLYSVNYPNGVLYL